MYPIMNAIIGSPRRYPPVGPNNTATPPEKLANTGIPIDPINKYIRIDINPHLEPKIKPVIETANICSVSGTVVIGSGIDTWANIEVKAANIEQKISSLVFNFRIIPPRYS